MKNLTQVVALSGTLMLAGGLSAESFTDADIEGSFYPIKMALPLIRAIRPVLR